MRALHHYDALGLLVPAQRSFSGHRLYCEQDVRRLYRIVALRRTGMALGEISRALDARDADVGALLARQVDQLEEEIRERVELRDRLVAIADRLADQDGPSIEDYLEAIERNLTMEKHFTPEQMQQLERRREQVGAQAIKRSRTSGRGCSPRCRPRRTAARRRRIPSRSASPRGCGS